MMSDLLDRLESALQEVEDQLLAEFERIRNSLSGEPYSSIDSDLKNAVNETVMGLWHELEHIGDSNQLTLRTERQEKISFRMIVVKKLLDAKIPTAYLAEAQEEIEESRREAESKSTPDKYVAQAEVTIKEHTGFLETVMQFFRGKPVPHDVTRSGSDITAEEESGKVEIYLDTVYAAQHLAVIAARFQTRGDDKDMMNAVAGGKAVFQSRDLSDSMPKVSKRKSSDAKDESEEEIRRKPESTVRHTGGASTFESRELSTTIPPMPSKPVKPVAEKDEERDIAQTPDEIRKKLEARPGDSGSFGKASFGSKDIEPQEVPVPREAEEEPVREEPVERPTGKAVFGSKDLSSPDEE